MGPPEAPLLIERALRTVEVSLGTPIDEFVRTSHLPVDDTIALIYAAVDPRPTIDSDAITASELPTLQTAKTMV
jgi:hypothetical protein